MTYPTLMHMFEVSGKGVEGRFGGVARLRTAEINVRSGGYPFDARSR